MKKLFTLLFLAMSVVCAKAQDGQYIVTADLEIDPSQDALADDNFYIWITFGDDTYSASTSSSLPSPYEAFLSGTTNPSLYSSDYPIGASGCYYSVSAYEEGTLELGIVLNASKSLRIVDWYTGEYVDYQVFDSDGNEVEVSEDGQVSSKVYGTVVFDVELYGMYDVYAKGSKLGFAGFQFWLPSSEEDTDDEITDGIATIKSETEESPIYNLSGQKVDSAYKGVVIKNGKKTVQK